MKNIRFTYPIATFFILVLLQSCSEDSSHLFTKIDGSSTGIHFKNTLVENDIQNVLNYAYFYNGGGVATGDINNDGLTDVLFTGNMVSNRLYLNKGNFEFEDITDKAGIAKMQGWCTGATMADVNADGKLDIYICRSADAIPARRKNLLFINNGDLTFKEQAEQYGLADEGYSTQASFFDYDKDGDLDMFVINHSLQQYATGSYENGTLRKQQRPEFANKLYRNDNGHYKDVSKEAGITSNVLTFGLGLAVSDVNNDDWLDIHVSNDFNEPDYLFMNNHNGTFSEKLNECMDEASLYSMGSDFADFNNDGLTDLVTLDMLPEDNNMQKMHSGAENFDKFQMLFQQGFYYQYSRNMLHKNNGDGTFSEIGQLAGVSNTDWSWTALFSDFDNDGNKDLFITNGYAKDNTNMDFIKYSVDRTVKARRGEPLETTKEMLEMIPSIKMPNYIFQNNGNNSFTKKTNEWGLPESTVSSGAVYADLDNDGDMDLVMNNVNDEAGIYKNNADKLFPNHHFLKIKLLGDSKNINGIGSRVKVYSKGNLYMQEQMPVRGFQSSVDYVLNFGLDSSTTADSVLITWPTDREQKLVNVKANQTLTLKLADANIPYHYDSLLTANAYFTKSAAPAFKHEENVFNDFTVQTLLPNYLSRQGPCMAKADINNDGKEDIFIGGAKGHAGEIFIQSGDGSFIAKAQPAVLKDTYYEDVAAAFFDADNDGDTDLYVASGGYEFGDNDPYLQDRLYINDGKGNFTKEEKALPPLLFSKSCVKAADIDNDGDMDLFVGGRVVPGRYPLSPVSKILLNDGKGKFTDATKTILPGLDTIGMVTDALWLDINNDKQNDLIVVGEWMPIKVFINEKGRLKDASAVYISFPSNGWWNRIMAEDFDGDGDKDLVIGNVGLNTQFKASDKEPFTLVYKDFDGNGSIDPIMCYYIQGVSHPLNSRDDLTDQLPGLKKKFLEYHSYADATLNDIFTPEQLKDVHTLKADMMQTIYLENKGKDGFVLKQLPAEAQYAPVYAMAALDINGDGKKDMVLAGNNAWTRIKFGRYRANHGVALLGDGKGNFTYVPQWKAGLKIRDDIRSMEVIQSATNTELLFGANDAEVKAYKLKK